MKISQALATSTLWLALLPFQANAQFNGSNSSGTNTTSFSGTSNSIWNSDSPKLEPTRYPTQTYNDTPVVIACPPVDPRQTFVCPDLKPVVVEKVIIKEVPVIVEKVIKVYPKAKNKAPRGRG